MVILKNDSELLRMKHAGEISAIALYAGGKAVRPGVTTKEIDTLIHDTIVSYGAKPSFLGYNGFKGSACISVNEEVIHGIPGKRVLREGDIVSVDVGAYIDGYHGDNAATFAVGAISTNAQHLIDATKESLNQAIKQVRAGARIGDVSAAVENYVRGKGYGLELTYTGHGIGRDLHEDPEVPNYGTAGRGPRLLPGMVIAIEPMVIEKGDVTRQLADGWTIVTANGSLAAHFEHTVAVTNDGPLILTALPEGV